MALGYTRIGPAPTRPGIGLGFLPKIVSFLLIGLFGWVCAPSLRGGYSFDSNELFSDLEGKITRSSSWSSNSLILTVGFDNSSYIFRLT